MRSSKLDLRPACLLAAFLSLACGDDVPDATGGGSTGSASSTGDGTTIVGSGDDGLDSSTGAPGNGWVERATQLRFAPGSGDFWDLPIPSDLRREDDGTFDLEDWPDATAKTAKMWLDVGDRRLVDGWGINGGIIASFTAAIDPATLPEDGAGTLAAEASVYLIDVDPESPQRGQRLPIQPRFTAPELEISPPNVLTVLPVFGAVRRPATTYALVVTDRVHDTSGEPVGRSEPFHLAFENEAGADPSATQNLAPLRSTLEELGIDPSEVVGAAVFRTFDPDTNLRTLADWAEAQPLPALAEPWQVSDEYESYQVLTARFTVPVIQSGERPYSEIGEGLIVRDDAGVPVIQSTQDVRLNLTIPKMPQPPGGFPLTMYLHGSGGNNREAIDRGPKPEVEDAPDAPPGTGPAEWLARRGVATIAHDFPLHGDRNDPPDTTGLALYNLFGNIDATIDNFDVSAMELLLLSRLVLETEVDASLAPTLDPGADPGGIIRFDPARLTAMGQSMGTTLGARWAAADPRLQGAVWSGAGGIIVEIGLHAVEPVDLHAIAAGQTGIPADELTEAHPFLPMLQHVWDFADPVSVARHVVREPYRGLAPKQVLMTAGFLDGYFTPASQAAIGGALGIPLAGERVEPVVGAALELFGLPDEGYPVQGNVDGTTAAVVQHAAPHTLGHYVVFNQEGPRHQYTCFLASVGTAGGAIIPAPATDADPCP